MEVNPSQKRREQAEAMVRSWALPLPESYIQAYIMEIALALDQAYEKGYDDAY